MAHEVMGKARASVAVLGLWASVAACSSDGGDEGSGTAGVDVDSKGDDGTQSESCSPAAIAPLRRMASSEYEQTLRDLVGDDALDQVASLLAGLPADDPEARGAFAREDQRLTDRHIETWYRVADGLARQVVTDEALRTRLFGECARDAFDESCLRDAARSFLRRVYRRPAQEDELGDAIDRALELKSELRYHALTFQALISPAFLYHLETSGEAAADRTLELRAHELAARLSYHVWGTAPDQELRRAADDGTLTSDAGYQAQVERLFADSRAQWTRREFFGQWLELQGGGFTRSPRLEVLRDGIELDGLAQEMQDEVWDALDYHVDQGDSWAEVLRSQQSFARGSRLADIYGVTAWSGRGAPPVWPADQRAGLLTRAGLLYTQDGSTNPFRRGAFLRRALLCDIVAPPPANLPPDALETPKTQPGTSTRTAFERKVKDQPCASCHSQFSALGYAMETYDGLGRYRQVERLIDDDGVDHGTAAVDPEVTPRVTADDDQVTSGPAQLVERMIETGKADACLAETYLRFTGRNELQSGDQCRVDRLADRLAGGESVAEAMRSVVLDPSFRRRRVAD